MLSNRFYGYNTYRTKSPNTVSTKSRIQSDTHGHNGLSLRELIWLLSASRGVVCNWLKTSVLHICRKSVTAVKVWISYSYLWRLNYHYRPVSKLLVKVKIALLQCSVRCHQMGHWVLRLSISFSLLPFSPPKTLTSEWTPQQQTSLGMYQSVVST